ncbi:LOW QUALITY PROTEIN: hypothetical protein V2J09_000749 [Rumex salicifolius]
MLNPNFNKRTILKWITRKVTNKLADMLSQLPLRAFLIALQFQPIVPTEYSTMYFVSADFRLHSEQAITGRVGEFSIRDDLLFKHQLLCVLEEGDRLQWVQEAHTSRVVDHKRINNVVLNLCRYVFWSKMKEDVTRYGVFCVAHLNHLTKNDACTFLCRYHCVLGRASRWTLLEVCRRPSEGLINCLWPWFGAARWLS